MAEETKSAEELAQERLSIMERIGKVLNLRDKASNQEEAFAAMSRAQTLLAKYHMNELDVVIGLAAAPKPERKVEEEGIVFGNNISNWQGSFAATIARNFRTKCYWGHQIRGNAYVRTLQFYGFPEDLQVTLYTYHTAAAMAEYLATKHVDAMRPSLNAAKSIGRSRVSTKGFKQSFLAGFTSGLSQRLVENAQSMNKNMALMLVTPNAVKEYEAHLNLTSRKIKRSTVDESSYHAGVDQGRNWDSNVIYM